jgi:FkbM family methyltransferase
MQNLKATFGWYLSKFLYEGNPFKKIRAKKFYSQFVGKDDLCFDVGAHLGDRSKVWLELGAKVVGVEPQPKFSNYLADKFKNNLSYFNEQIGLGSEKGKATLHISNMFPTLSTLADQEWRKQIDDATALTINYDSSIEINVTTLDELVKKYGNPRFIKIDVEGYEAEVLKGLTQKVESLSFEFLSFNLDTLDQSIDLLQRLGYTTFNWSYGETFKFVMANWSDAQTLKKHIQNFKKGTFGGDVYCK